MAYRNSLRCRSNEQLRSQGASTHEKMVVEMPAKWQGINDVKESVHGWLSEWIDQPMNQWMSESVNDWINEWGTQRINVPMSESMNQRMEEGMNHSMNQCFRESMNEWTHESMNERTNMDQHGNFSRNQWINQWISEEWIDELVKENQRMNEWMSELHLVELPIHPFPKPSLSQLPLRWAQLVLHWAIEPPLRWATSFAKLPLFSATSSLTCLLLSGPLLILWPASNLSYLPVSAISSLSYLFCSFCKPILLFAQPLQSVYEPSAAVPHSSVTAWLQLSYAQPCPCVLSQPVAIPHSTNAPSYSHHFGLSNLKSLVGASRAGPNPCHCHFV